MTSITTGALNIMSSFEIPLKSPGTKTKTLDSSDDANVLPCTPPIKLKMDVYDNKHSGCVKEAFQTIPIAFENNEDQLESSCSHHSITIAQDQYPGSKDDQQRHELNADINLDNSYNDIGDTTYFSESASYMFPQTVYVEEKLSIDETGNTSSPTATIYEHMSKAFSSIQSKNDVKDVCSQPKSLHNASYSDEKKQTKKKRKQDFRCKDQRFATCSRTTQSNLEYGKQNYKNKQNSKQNEENIPGLDNKKPTFSYYSQDNDDVQNQKVRTCLLYSKHRNKSNIEQTNWSIHERSDLKPESPQETKSIYCNTKNSLHEMYVSRTSERKVCHCKKSKCLKLYCECFAASMYCDPNLCACFDCYNLEEFNEKRQNAIDNALSRNPDAFTGKLSKAKKRAEMLKNAMDGGWIPSINEGEQNKLSISSSGCNCKKSRCLKKYCDCFYVQAYCSEWCKCRNCLNYEGSEKRAEALTKKRNDEEKEQERYEKSRNRRQFTANIEPHQLLSNACNDRTFTKNEKGKDIAFAHVNEIEDYEDDFVSRDRTSDDNDNENENYNIPIAMV